MTILIYLDTLPADTETLDISDRKLTPKDLEDVIAYVIEKDWPLRQLNFSCNRVTEIPASLGQLTSLQSLCFYHNQVMELPDSLGNLTRLQYLSFFS